MDFFKTPHIQIQLPRKDKVFKYEFLVLFIYPCVILILLIEVSKLLRFSISEYLQMTWLPVSRMWVAALPVLQGLEVGELQLVKVPQLLAHSGGVLWRRGWRTPRGDKYNCALCSKANSGREN